MYTPRVLLLTDADVFAGTERHFLDLAIALRDLSVDVSVACPASAPLAIRAMAAGIQFIPIAKRGAIDFAAVRTLKDLLHSERIDLIHAHNGRTHLAAAMAVARAGRGVCVATQHFLSPTRTSRRGLKAWISRRIHSYVLSQLELENRGLGVKPMDSATRSNLRCDPIDAILPGPRSWPFFANT